MALYGGSSWTSATSLPAAGRDYGGAGISTAGVLLSGNADPSPANTNVLNYNGSSWTSGTAFNTARIGAIGSVGGTQTATLMVGGRIVPSAIANVESWNGSSWTSGTSYPIAISTQATSKNAPYTSNICAGGNNPSPPAIYSAANLWNGSGWTATTSLPANRFVAGGIGSTQSSFIVAGGGDGVSTLGSTFAYSAAALATKTITTS